MTLIKPTKDYIKQYIEGLKSLEKENVNYIHTAEDVMKNPDLEIEKIWGRHIYWMIDKACLVGRVEIRDTLTEELKVYGGHIGYTIYPEARRKGYGNLILKLALEKTKKMGLTKVLLTCDSDNEGSIKIIENNRGVLQDCLFDEESQKEVLRYWIEL